MLGLLVLFLSFLMIYNTGEGNRMLADVDASLTGVPLATKTVAPPAAQSPEQTLAASLRAMGGEVQAGSWTKAGASLRKAESAWARASGTYQQKGVTPTDLNAMTGDLAELQMDVAQKDAKDALTQIQNARKSVAAMAAVAVAGATPSLDAMGAIVTDLQSALEKNDLARAKADAQALAAMLQTAEKGF